MLLAVPVNIFPVYLTASEARFLFQPRHDRKKEIYVVIVIKGIKVLFNLTIVYLPYISFFYCESNFETELLVFT